MKKGFVIAVMVLISACVMAQEKKENSKTEQKVNVPELVKKVFAQKFTNATKVKWSLEKAGEYEAEFNFNKKEMSAVINEKGDLLVVETEIKETELPLNLKNLLIKDFAGYKISECEKAESKGKTTYEMEAKKDKLEYELVFDSEGKLLKKEEKKD